MRIALASGAIDPGKITRIELRNVSIAYDDAGPVVRDISFELRSGELAALAGPSGTGKTTHHLRDPALHRTARRRNSHQWDRCAANLARRARAENIGFVFQQEALFSRSIADNIRYGAPDATEAQMREAARIAGAADFIEALPEKYHTMLGRRGARLSVGQKQRIAIARALIRQPDVLILDEPTAPLDPQSETDLMRTLRDLARDRIVLIVAHRAGTLAACDRIVFASAGSIVATGSQRGVAPDLRALSRISVDHRIRNRALAAMPEWHQPTAPVA